MTGCSRSHLIPAASDRGKKPPFLELTSRSSEFDVEDSAAGKRGKKTALTVRQSALACVARPESDLTNSIA
jgi:hypothetical protein